MGRVCKTNGWLIICTSVCEHAHQPRMKWVRLLAAYRIAVDICDERLVADHFVDHVH
jgi:hypothetical protein